jgi:integrase
MAQITKRITATGESRYDVRTRIGGRVVTRTFRRRKDADNYATTTEADRLRGVVVDPRHGQVTFETYAKSWLAHRHQLRPTTRELYGVLLAKWLEPEVGDLAIGKMTPEVWRTWYAKAVRKHPASHQPGKEYKLARAILNTAVEDGLIVGNPCRVKNAAAEHSPERHTASVDEVYAIADAITPRYRSAVLLGAFCSLRFGEIAGLRRRRIDVLHRTITVEEQAVELAGGRVEFGPPKSEAGRRVLAIPDELVADLEDHLAEHVGADSEALVFTSREGHPLRRTKFRTHWADACTKESVEGLHFHDLRHTGATLAASAGATLRELMNRLGHTSPTVALRYQHATIARERAIAESLGEVIRAAKAKPKATVTSATNR